MDTQQPDWLTNDGAATYRICVGGMLGTSWSKRLMGMGIRAMQPADEPPVTVLEGELADQAALIGVLLALYELQMPLLSIECTSARRPTSAAILR